MSYGPRGSRMMNAGRNGDLIMSLVPQIQARAAQRYAGIPMRVTMGGLPGAAP